MNCDQVRERISALVDGELTPETRSQVEEHITMCVPCEREREALLSLRRSMEQWQSPRLNPFAASRIEEALLKHGRKPRSLWRALPQLSLATAGAAAVLWMLRVGSHQEPTRTETVHPTRPSISEDQGARPPGPKRELRNSKEAQPQRIVAAHPLGNAGFAPKRDRVKRTRLIVRRVEGITTRPRPPSSTSIQDPIIIANAGLNTSALASEMLAEVSAVSVEAVYEPAATEHDLRDMVAETMQ